MAMNPSDTPSKTAARGALGGAADESGGDLRASIAAWAACAGRCYEGRVQRLAEVGTDPAYALRTATGQYRTTPLRGLWQHAPYFHDGSAPDLLAVVNHYDQKFNLNLTPAQKADLVEFLKSL
jgi:cytochrome c peroxidase